MTVSIIIPMLNEARHIQAQLQSVQDLRTEGCEIIAVDGGSSDNTLDLARDLVDRAELSAQGRGVQQNRGAMYASGDLLVFLHADTRLPANAAEIFAKMLAKPEPLWGWFRVRLDAPGWVFRMVERMMHLRSRLQKIATGDQVIYISRELFERVGGFADIPLMEDIELCRRLRRLQKPEVRTEPVVTSARRWVQRGAVRTILLMWWLRLVYALGVSPMTIARWYGLERPR